MVNTYNEEREGYSSMEFLKIVGEGTKTKIEKGILFIRAANKMLGYLNAPSPFDDYGWYNTKDIVEERDGRFSLGTYTLNNRDFWETKNSNH